MMSAFSDYTKLLCLLLAKQESGELGGKECDDLVLALEHLWEELSDTDKSLLENMRDG